MARGDIGASNPHEMVGQHADFEMASDFASVHIGDHDRIACVTACGRCPSCRKGMYSYCEECVAWIAGDLVDGMPPFDPGAGAL